MNGKPWTEADEALLEDLYGNVPTTQIAKRLDRTMGSVRNRAQRLGLGPNRPADVLTAYDVMRILDMQSYSTFVRWVDAGWLVAERKPAAYGITHRPDWWIRQGDLERFLHEHPHLFDRDRIDPAFRQYVPERWVTFVEAFRRGAAHPNLLESAVKAGLVPMARKRGELGTRWAIPESLIPELRDARRRMTTDEDHRRLVVAYDRLRTRDNLKGQRRLPGPGTLQMARRLSDGGRTERAA